MALFDVDVVRFLSGGDVIPLLPKPFSPLVVGVILDVVMM